jgi:hypothetical protein
MFSMMLHYIVRKAAVDIPHLISLEAKWAKWAKWDEILAARPRGRDPGLRLPHIVWPETHTMATDGDIYDPSLGKVIIDLTQEPDEPPVDLRIRDLTDPTLESRFFPSSSAFAEI